MMMQSGKLVISLDFELYWGVFDCLSLEEYKQNLLGTHKAIPLILELFQEYDIHATWATVGSLFYPSLNQLLTDIPQQIPDYQDRSLSLYHYIKHHRIERGDHRFYFAPELIKLICAYPHQEIGSHTFSHYYCLEEGQTLQDFQADVAAFQKVAAAYQLQIQSFVFPRNQVHPEYLSTLTKAGIHCYRGNEKSWIYQPTRTKQQTSARRLLRFIDQYVNLTGHHAHQLSEIASSYPYNMTASRFLRPYSRWGKLFEPLKIKRILSDLTYTAKCGHVYHLWWHPHNFGQHVAENLAMLRKILDHFQALKQSYDMQSMNMGELSSHISSATEGRVSS